MSEQRVEKIFTSLLRERGIFIGRVNSVNTLEQVLISSGTCPYCQTPVLDDVYQVFCKSCGIPHHDECWQENGHCAVFGCGQMQNLKTGLERNKEQSLIVLGEDDLADEPEDNQANKTDRDYTQLWITIGGIFFWFILMALSGC